MSNASSQITLGEGAIAGARLGLGSVIRSTFGPQAGVRWRFEIVALCSGAAESICGVPKLQDSPKIRAITAVTREVASAIASRRPSATTLKSLRACAGTLPSRARESPLRRRFSIGASTSTSGRSGTASRRPIRQPVSPCSSSARTAAKGGRFQSRRYRYACGAARPDGRRFRAQSRYRARASECRFRANTPG